MAWHPCVTLIWVKSGCQIGCNSILRVDVCRLPAGPRVRHDKVRGAGNHQSTDRSVIVTVYYMRVHLDPLASHVWDSRYRLRGDEGAESAIEECWARTARALATVERSDCTGWERRFYAALEDFRFLPGGRILAGAGSPRKVTLCIIAEIRRHGMRNSHLTAVAPTGSINLLAGNVSSGFEPIFASDCERRLKLANGDTRVFSASDYACRVYRGLKPDAQCAPPAFVTADEIDSTTHLATQAALQPYVDNAISKTINAPADVSFEQWRSIYATAYRLGLKGITAFRPNRVRKQVLARRCNPSDADTIKEGRGAGTACD